MPDTAVLSALLTDYLDQLDHRLDAVDELRRQAGALDQRGSAELLPLLDGVGDTVRGSDESARVLLRWLRAGPT